MTSTPFQKQFFGKVFQTSLLSFFALFVCSVVAYAFQLEWLFLAILALITFIATIKHLEWGIGIAFLELVSNAHGNLFFAPIGSFNLTGRMVIFLAIFFAWSILLLTKKSRLPALDTRLTIFIPLFVAISIGFLTGFLRHDVLTVFKDGNAYFYLAYLFPILSIEWTALRQNAAIQMLSAAAIFSSVTTIAILYAYTHFSELVLEMLYIFLRDIRFAEITHVGNGMYRVFQQTQLFAIVFGFMLIPHLFTTQTKRDKWITIGTLSLIFCTLLLSLSRSFWFGVILASAIFLALYFRYASSKWTTFFSGLGKGVLAMMFSAILLVVVVLFPYPQIRTTGQFLSSIFASRTTNSDDVAVTSRWNLLQPMMDGVKESPIIGNGFGQTVTFITDDPRVRAKHPDGAWTTYSMEWSWIELWLKMGIPGPMAFLIVGGFIVSGARRLLTTDHAWIGSWMMMTIVFLFATNVFSPYLNHPIGIGTILLLLIFLPNFTRIHNLVFNRSVQQKTPQTSFAVSSMKHRKN